MLREEFVNQLGQLSQSKIDEILDIFRNCPEYVLNEMRFVCFEHGQTINPTGVLREWVYIILKGTAVAIDLQMPGKMYRYRDFLPGEIVGDVEVIGNISETISEIKAVNDCETIAIPARVYRQWMRTDIHALSIRTEYLLRITVLEKAFDRKCLFLNCKDRLMLFLVERYETPVYGHDFRIRNTQTEIAENIGYNVRTVQRNIYNLENEGYLSVVHGKVSISIDQIRRIRDYVQEQLLIEGRYVTE